MLFVLTFLQLKGALNNFNILSLCLQKEFTGMQDKYKKAMMTNASLDNEKQTLRHTVDTLKDQSEELEEQNIELVRENKDRCRVST